MQLIRTILNQQPRVASILTVILLVWVIAGLNVQYSGIWPTADVSQEQSVPADDQPSEQKSVTLSSFNEAVIPISKIQILFVYHFFQEWDLVEEDAVFMAKDIPLPPNRFFLTLFRQIISPNAP